MVLVWALALVSGMVQDGCRSRVMPAGNGASVLRAHGTVHTLEANVGWIIDTLLHSPAETSSGAWSDIPHNRVETMRE